MTHKQMMFLTAIYKKDLTLNEIYNKTGLKYEDYLEITEIEDFLKTYVVIYDRIKPEDDLYGLNNVGIEAVEKHLFKHSETLFNKRISIAMLIISILSVGVSIYSLHSQKYLESKLLDIEKVVVLNHESDFLSD